MKRYYIFKWYQNKNKLERTNKVVLSYPTGKVERDAQKATELFISGFGNLKQNTIISIKEFDENDNQIGEDIVPDKDAIIPIPKA